MDLNRRSWRAAAIVCLAFLAVGVTGCAETGAESRPQAPAQWDGGDISRPPEPGDLTMSLAIWPDGSADLVNIPGGQWIRTDDGICWDDTDEVYSGPATWTFFKQRGIEVKFDDSDVIFWAWPGKFGSYDWSEFRIFNCSGDKEWGMALSCGSAGLEELPPCKEP